MGQPIGFPLPHWTPPPHPPRVVLEGRYCRAEPLDAAKHGADLDLAIRQSTAEEFWTYLPYGPFSSAELFRQWLADQSLSTDPMFYAFIDVASGKAVGLSGYLRITPAVGCIEVGHVLFSPLMRRTRIATDAMYLMMKQAFQLGYRRYEWKCDSLHQKSRAAAVRFGFRFEGIFRQAIVYKGRNRDTSWFSVLDSEWPELEAASLRWLDPANFDQAGEQRLRLSELTAARPTKEQP